MKNYQSKIQFVCFDNIISYQCMLHKECFLTCGSGRSGKSTASLAYTPSRDLKSGMPQETETPAPVNTMIRLEVPM